MKINKWHEQKCTSTPANFELDLKLNFLVYKFSPAMMDVNYILSPIVKYTPGIRHLLKSRICKEFHRNKMATSVNSTNKLIQRFVF